MQTIEKFEILFQQKIAQIASLEDPAHDMLHFQRVVELAKRFCKIEGGQLEVVVPAAWLHDFVIIPKDSPLRSQASKLSAVKAIEFLREIHYPQEFYEAISHAIEGHSFSANIQVKTIEAKIVQDADRLDGLGAIGIARCFATAGSLKRAFYCSIDPFCEVRRPDDSQFTVDHFFKKLFKTAETLQTPSGIKEGGRRIQVLKNYLADLRMELL